MSLNSDIESLNRILSKHGEKRWILNKVSSEQSARNLLQSFGGMGSINDIYICRANGHQIDLADEATENEKIRNLLKSIHNQCVELITK